MITVEELSERTGIKLKHILYFINFSKKRNMYFFKAVVDHTEKNKNGQQIVRKRNMWCIDDDKIEAYNKYYQEHHKEKPKVSNGLTGADRLAWTDMARECYAAKCNCKNCNNNRTCAEVEKITHERKMKGKVVELVRELGYPPERITG